MHSINFRFQRIAIVYVYMARQRFFASYTSMIFQQAVYAETGLPIVGIIGTPIIRARDT